MLRRLLLVALLLLLVAGAVFYFRPFPTIKGITRVAMWARGGHSRWITVDGHPIHYWEQNTSNAATPRILLIHGLGGSSQDWAPIIPKLSAAGFAVYALDLPGFGDSPRAAAPLTIAQHAQVAADFARAVGITRSHVAGWSMGGWVAMRYTLDHPEMVDRLVLNDAAGAVSISNVDPNMFTPRNIDDVRSLESHLEPTGKRLPDFILRDALRYSREVCCVVRDTLTQLQTGSEVLGTQLHAITAPTLLNWGAEDQMIPVTAGRETQRLIPGANLYIYDDCGHLAPARCADRVTPATIAFLKAEPAPRGQTQTFPAK